MNYNLLSIADGFVFFPSKWVVVKNNIHENCRYVGTVEVRNGASYNVPHFLFFSKTPINRMGNKEKEKIMTACTEAYPAFKEILERQVQAEFDEKCKLTNAEQLLLAPTVGLFQIPIFGESPEFPAGAMVVRTCKG